MVQSIEFSRELHVLLRILGPVKWFDSFLENVIMSVPVMEPHPITVFWHFLLYLSSGQKLGVCFFHMTHDQHCNQWSQTSWWVHQGNQRIYSVQGFFGSFNAPWYAWFGLFIHPWCCTGPAHGLGNVAESTHWVNDLMVFIYLFIDLACCKMFVLHYQSSVLTSRQMF